MIQTQRIMTGKQAHEERSLWRDLAVATIQYRSARGISQEALGEMIGVSRTAIGNFEQGTSVLHPRSLERLIRIVRSPGVLLASKLRTLAEELESPYLSEQAKAKLYLEGIESLLKSATVYTSAFEESQRSRE